MGCGCTKKTLNEEDLNVSEENKINSKISEDLLNNKNRDDTLVETKNQESIIESKIDKENDSKENDNKKNENDIKKKIRIKNQYSQRVFELINLIRLNPPGYSKTILDNIKYISFESIEETNKNNEMKEIKEFPVFKKKVKVKLYRGEECFLDAADILANTPPMDELKFDEDIIIPLPDNEKDLKNPEFIKKKVEEIKSHSNINAYYKEYIKNPEIAVLLMIIDDTEKSERKKRKSILNKEFKNIGIDSKFIGKSFIAHFSFSK
jgi:hypothetical protein